MFKTRCSTGAEEEERIESGQSEEFIDGVTGRGGTCGLARELLTYAIGVFSARAFFNDVFIHRCFHHRPPQELAAVETLEELGS
jgi:hypothetical protein